MARQRSCFDCKKQLTDKYYLIVGFPHNHEKASRANYCSECCAKWKQDPKIRETYCKLGWIKFIEKEVGDSTEDKISEFEDRWEKHCYLGIKKTGSDNKALLNSIQQARQELEPYLQKPGIVGRSYEREYGGCGISISMSFYFLFAKDAREPGYKQKVVRPTVEKILGGKVGRRN